MLAYQGILSTFPDEPEAHWGITLCRYGIEYVDDPVTHSKKPTIHRVSYNRILDDSDYLAAMDYADVVAREVYQEQAKEIADIQNNLLAISQKEDPFDIFICYKETDENGKRTRDSVIGQEIYQYLTKEGYKVFFSRVTLEGKLGTMYEPYIFAALNSARIMLVIGTKPEYFEAVWVKNEWSRFLDLMKTRPEHHLIPCYRDMDAYEMPESFLPLQSQDLSKLGFIQDLLNGINKIMGRGAQKSAKEVALPQSNANVKNLLTRAEILIADKDYEKADALLERALDNDPKNSRAYLLKLVIDLELCSVEDLKCSTEPFDSNSNYKRAVEFANEAEKVELAEIDKAIAERTFRDVYLKGEEALRNEDYASAYQAFMEISDWKDAKSRAEECLRLENDRKYAKAEEALLNKDYMGAYQAFMEIPEWKDSKLKAEECSRLEREREFTEAESEKAFAYERALYDFETKMYDKALETFRFLGDYRDSQQRAEICENLRKEEIYKASQPHELKTRKDCEILRDKAKALRAIADYKDSLSLAESYETKAFEREKILKRRKLAIYAIPALAIVALVISIIVPLSVFVWDFEDNGVFYRHRGDNSVCVIGAKSGLQDLTIPNEVRGLKVHSIEERAFKSYKALKSVKISGEVKSIEWMAFMYCYDLQSLEICEGVSRIGSDSFFMCESLKTIKIPGSVSSIGGGAFGDCASLKSVEICEGVTGVGDQAFRSCPVLRTIIWPDSLAGCASYHMFDEDLKNCKVFCKTKKPKYPFLESSIYYYSETYKEGKYWHYVDGKPTVW